MNLLRLLILAIAVWLGWVLLRRWLRSRDSPPPVCPQLPLVQMVRCVHCGIHVPQGNAIGEGGRWYCGFPHLEADRTNRRSGD
jgi:uncharacterized protein